MLLDLLKALADPCRLRLVAILLRGEFTVQELTGIMGMGQSRISRHLKILTEAGVLSVKRQGTWSYYRVGNASPFFSAIRPDFEQELATLPERSRDLTFVAQVLEERRQRSQEFFNRHASQWDDLARTLLPVPEYRGRLLELLPRGGSVLEIGIGTGGLLTELAARADQVIGVDHSPAMLEEARRRLAEAGLDRIDLRLGEMTHLPLPDASVDCVVTNMVLHHAADPPAVLAEIRRVLARGGVLMIADLARHERETAREQLADQWLGFEEEELSGWLKGAGFDEVACKRVEGTNGQEAVLVITATTPQPTTPQPPPQRGGGVGGIENCPLPGSKGGVGGIENCPLPSSKGGVGDTVKFPPPGSGGAGGGQIHNVPEMKPLRKSLRNEATSAEQKAWGVLKQSNLGGYKFRRQHSVGRYIVDFYCPSHRLAVELDGDSHFTDEAIEYDLERTKFLNALNIRVLRFLNTDVHQNLDAVCEKILEELKATTP